MSENISASKILAQFKKGRRGVSSRLFLERLNRLEERKRRLAKTWCFRVGSDLRLN